MILDVKVYKNNTESRFGEVFGCIEIVVVSFSARFYLRKWIKVLDRNHVRPKAHIAQYVLHLATNLCQVHVFAKLLLHILNMKAHSDIYWHPKMAIKPTDISLLKRQEVV